MASNSKDRFTVDKALAVLYDISSSELSDFSTESEQSERSFFEASTDETSGSEVSGNESATCLGLIHSDEEEGNQNNPSETTEEEEEAWCNEFVRSSKENCDGWV